MTTLSSRIQFILSVALIVFIYLSFIGSAVISFKFFNYNQHQNESFKARNVTLNNIYISACLFTLYILIPFILVSSHIIPLHSSVPSIMTEIADLCIFSSFYLRTWILWFDRLFVEHLQVWMWRREVNHQDSHILIKHRQIFKSSVVSMSALYLLVLIPIFITLQILEYMTKNEEPSNMYIARTFLLAILWFISYALIKNLSSIFDEYYVRTELLQSIKTSGIAYLMAHVLYFVLLHALDDSIATFTKLFLFCVTEICILYSCHCCIKKHEFRNKVELANRIRNSAKKASFISLISRSLNFEQIMNSKQGFFAMCHHLQNEISLESILFLLELTQFKGIIYEILDGQIKNNIPALCSSRLSSPRNAQHAQVKQNLIFNAERILNATWLPIDPRMRTSKPFVIGVYLYDKYIEETADLCLNISFETRQRIYRFFQELHLSHQNHQIQDIDLNDIYHIFDDAFVETWHLIATDSYFRFRTTDLFMQLYASIYPKAAKQAEEDLAKIVERTLLRAKEYESEPIIGVKVEFTPRITQETPESHTISSSTATSTIRGLLKSKMSNIMDNFAAIPSQSVESTKTITMVNSVDFASKTDYTAGESIATTTGNSTVSRDSDNGERERESAGNAPTLKLQFRLKGDTSSKTRPALKKSISEPLLNTDVLVQFGPQRSAKTTDDIHQTQNVLMSVLQHKIMTKYRDRDSLVLDMGNI